MTEHRIAVLLSTTPHPVNGRLVMSPTDATALALAQEVSGAAVAAVHAGDPQEPALRGYLGLGAAEITVLPWPATASPVPALVDWLENFGPSLIVTGSRLRTNGTLPYRVAAALRMPVVHRVRSFTRHASEWLIDQDAGYGRLRRLTSDGPAVVMVSSAAGAAPMSTFLGARRGRITVSRGRATIADTAASPMLVPARRRPAALEEIHSDNFVDRVRFVCTEPEGDRSVLHGLSAQEVARQVLGEMRRLRVGTYAGKE